MHCFYKAKAAISADPVPDPSVAMSNLAEHSKLSRASLMRVAKVGCLMNTEPSTATSSSALSRFLQMAFTPEIPVHQSTLILYSTVYRYQRRLKTISKLKCADSLLNLEKKVLINSHLLQLAGQLWY